MKRVDDTEKDKENILQVIQRNIENITGGDIKKASVQLDKEFGVNELVLSSLDYVMLIVALEDDLELTFPDELLNFQNIKTVKALVDLLYTIKMNKNNNTERD